MNSMVIYGVTLVSSDGFECGCESNTQLFTTEPEAMNYAYNTYRNYFRDYDFDDGKDADGNDLKDRDYFVSELVNDGYVVIQGPDNHCQVEYFRKTITID